MIAKRTAKPQATYVVRALLTRHVYRDIEITASASLHDLAFAIVNSFNFDFDHAFGFFSKLTGNVYRSPISYDVFADEDGDYERGVTRTAVHTAFPSIGSKMLFLYDYGDNWKFTVRVLGVGVTESNVQYPRIVGTVGESPEQYPSAEDDG